VLAAILLPSCDYDYSWVKDVFYDYRFKPVTNNGNYVVSGTIRGSDIDEIDFTKYEIVDIESLNSWVEVSGIFEPNDTVIIYSITIDKEKLDLNYKQIMSADVGERVNFISDVAYQNFMKAALKKVAKKGFVDISIDGYINTENAKIYITLRNDLDVYVRQ
jgi:hypothetical protein